VLAGGLGGGLRAWAGVIEVLAPSFEILTWDDRRGFRPGRPASSEPDAWSVEAHARDLDAILRAEEWTRASLVGWGAGVPVVLEATRARPEVVDALVLMCGLASRPVDAWLGASPLRRLVPALLRSAERLEAPIAALLRRAARSRRTLRALRRLGLVSRALDETALAELLATLGELDLESYLASLRALERHDGASALGAIDAPTLVVGGDRDGLAPPALMRQMARALPRAEVLVVRGGTHDTPAEHPELVGARIRRFLLENARDDR
jgi:pimeloyl-ACP methyl ester carboxylesterase